MSHTLRSLVQIDVAPGKMVGTGVGTVSQVSQSCLLDVFRRYYPECSVNALDPGDNEELFTVSFYWSYKTGASRVFQYFIDKDDNQDIEVKTVITLHAFCCAILLPYWCIALADGSRQAIALIIEHFLQEKAQQNAGKFIDKSKVITNGLKYLQFSHPDLHQTTRITAIEWEAIFYLVNQDHTMNELKLNVELDDDVIKGMTKWYEQCVEDLANKETWIGMEKLPSQVPPAKES